MEDVKPLPTAETTGNNTVKDDVTTPNNGIIKRVQLPDDQKLEKGQFLELWQEQNRYIEHIEAKLKVCVTFKCNQGKFITPFINIFRFYAVTNNYI